MGLAPDGSEVDLVEDDEELAERIIESLIEELGAPTDDDDEDEDEA